MLVLFRNNLELFLRFCQSFWRYSAHDSSRMMFSFKMPGTSGSPPFRTVEGSTANLVTSRLSLRV
jgi:hypothetical protein